MALNRFLFRQSLPNHNLSFYFHILLIQSREILCFLFENEECQWAPKFLDVLENMGTNTYFVQEIRQAANEMKDDDNITEKFGNVVCSFA